ncbi:MAG: sensor histidine kinase [Kibdelosporangium sp.]
MDEWRRGFFGWHTVFAALAVLTAALVALDGGLAGAEARVALALLGALCVWYAVAGAKAITAEPGYRGLVYLVPAVVLTVALFAVSPLGSIMLFALYPHMWALLPRRGAMAGTVVVISATTVVIAAAGESIVLALALGCVTLLIGLALGLWISNIIEQSRHRATLVVTERQRLAREIHDTLAQGFAAMLLQLEAIEAEIGPDPRLAKAKAVARDNLAEARALVDALAPPDLHASTLPDALSRVARTRDAMFALTGKPRALPPTQEVMLLRAVQEALTNAGKHAAASRTEVTLSYGRIVTLQVKDNGIGFDPDQRTTGFGLTAMRARAAETGASLTVESAPGDGTTLRLEVDHAGTDR